MSPKKPLPVRRAYCRLLLLAAALCIGRCQAHAQDGTITESKPVEALPPFEQADEFTRKYFERGTYEAARQQTRFDCVRIRYRSGDATVSGLLYRPHDPGDAKLPVIIYNRGGTGNFGRLDKWELVNFYSWAKAGFVVVASDYRFVDDKGRRDEWGGSDVDDVLNLVPLIAGLPYADASRLYLLGLSRGGTMTYLALKRGMAVKAAAVIGAVADLEAWGRYRPEFIKGDEGYDGWAKVWPDYEHHASEEYRARSAVCWADQLRVPLLLLHSRTDSLVPVTQSLSMATALQAAGKDYALHIYEQDGHSLPDHFTERNEAIVAWFYSHP